MRTRTWLQGFLDLGARKERDNVPAGDIARQEDTVLQALDLLDVNPGVVIADEVGMGKTYEALGVVAAHRHMNPKSRIVIVTPGPDLNTKWKAEFVRFSDPKITLFDFGDEVFAADSLESFVTQAKRYRILLVPVSVFHSARGGADQAHLLSLYFWWRRKQGQELHGQTINAIFKRFREGRLSQMDVEDALFLDHYGLEQLEPHLDEAFRRGRRGDAHEGLDDLFRAQGYEAFSSEDAVRRAIDLARFRLVRALLPDFDLMVVDEAHKLKNAHTLRSQAISTVFRRKYAKTLFLTATPFQLSIEELNQVFVTFSQAKGAPDDLMAQVDAFFADIREYQAAYDALYRAWAGLDEAAAVEFAALFAMDESLEKDIADPGLRAVASAVKEVRRLKQEKIEPGFRRWMIRSLREEKRQYRRGRPERLVPRGAGALPFLIYERFIAELFRQGEGTHKAAVQINMVSSYQAAEKGELLARGEGEVSAEAEPYRKLLRSILQVLPRDGRNHPKLDFVLRDALDAAIAGEKTLIFCARVATLTQMAHALEGMWEQRMLELWRRAFPEARHEDIFDEMHADEQRSRGRHSRLQARFHRPQEVLYLALRERYLRSLVPVEAHALEHLSEVVRAANVLLAEARVGLTSSKRHDWKLIKRCVESAAAAHWRDHSSEASVAHAGPLKALCDPNFIPYGLDLAADELEDDDQGEHTPSWRISEAQARQVLAERPHLWDHLSGELAQLDVDLRVEVVERLARYLTFKDVPFLADVLAAARAQGLDVGEVDPPRLLEFVDGFWTGHEDGRRWLDRLRAFLAYFVGRNEQQKRDILAGPIKTGDLVRQTKDGESRERLREAFNTPLHPMVLIANEVMQEGLDLHRNCRRIVHHDLAWNPAQLEQRVGRIDRLGSLTFRLRERDRSATLDVLYPLIRNTIDERLYRVVKEREKWLEFLLGAPPSFAEYAEEGACAADLPPSLAQTLAISLRPPAR
ncbi:helicase-related protein [Archangium lipolyticum]|uniref:helicase-related protein n=1 Tax=Archangium lipolyticum TaxID=2970465 RepID=UPI00214A8292|nr:helicase-related protein [Archangium lipolyticum]